MATGIVINGDKRILGKLGAVSGFLRNPKAAFQDIGEYLLEETDKNFESEGSRHGQRWARLKQKTLEEKIRLGYGSKQILERTGTLKKGFESEVKSISVRIHNDVPYYKYHQRGDGSLPKRRMLSTPEKVKQEVVDIFRSHVSKKVGV